MNSKDEIVNALECGKKQNKNENQQILIKVKLVDEKNSKRQIRESYSFFFEIKVGATLWVVRSKAHETSFYV